MSTTRWARSSRSASIRSSVGTLRDDARQGGSDRKRDGHLRPSPVHSEMMHVNVAHALIVVAAAVVAGAIAAVSGFGIGSILTPLLALSMGTKLAVAVVSIPHFIGTALRFVLIREHLDRRVLATFGVASAAGGLTGALLHV